ncbi:MAG: hypothetical protein Q8K75_02420 [Chlamydiales bacterium]|nr:hypothetical protein [Chlamydiales bacterium]
MEAHNAAGLLLLGKHQGSWWLLVGAETKPEVVGQYGAFSAKVSDGESEIDTLITRFQQESQSMVVDSGHLKSALASDRCITKDFIRPTEPPVTYRAHIVPLDASVIRLFVKTYSKNPILFTETEVKASAGKSTLRWVKLRSVIRNGGEISTTEKLDFRTFQLLIDLKPELTRFLPRPKASHYQAMRVAGSRVRGSAPF